MSGIFREGYFKGKEIINKGEVLKLRLVSDFFILSTILVIVVFVLLIITTSTYTRRVEVYGEIISPVKPINVVSHQQGYVAEKYFSPGDRVKEGEKIYKINTGIRNESGIISFQRKESIEQQINKIKEIISGLEEDEHVTIKDLLHQKEKYAELENESSTLISNADQSVKSFRKIVDDYAEHRKKGMITNEHYLSQLNNYYQQISLLNSLKLQNAQQKLQLMNLNKELNTKKIEHRNKVLDYEMKIKELEQQVILMTSEGEVYITASYDGVMVSEHTSLGQFVTFNDSLAQILPDFDGDYLLTLWVPDTTMPYLISDAAINVRYDAFPWQKFGQFSGTVKEISTVPATLQEMAAYRSAPREELIKSGGNYYRIICSLSEKGLYYEGRFIELSNGLTASVTLFLEKRSLWQWILSPLYEMQSSIAESV